MSANKCIYVHIYQYMRKQVHLPAHLPIYAHDLQQGMRFGLYVHDMHALSQPFPRPWCPTAVALTSKPPTSSQPGAPTEGQGLGAKFWEEERGYMQGSNEGFFVDDTTVSNVTGVFQTPVQHHQQPSSHPPITIPPKWHLALALVLSEGIMLVGNTIESLGRASAHLRPFHVLNLPCVEAPWEKQQQQPPLTANVW